MITRRGRYLFIHFYLFGGEFIQKLQAYVQQHSPGEGGISQREAPYIKCGQEAQRAGGKGQPITPDNL